MKISQVEVFRLKGTSDQPPIAQGQRSVQAVDIYPDLYRPQRAATREGPRQRSALYVRIESDEGAAGLYGPLLATQGFIIQETLGPFLVGRDPLAGELLLDQMLRLNRHGRSGLFVAAISAVDCALWDLRGKVADAPVYRLLGGATRDVLPLYASMLGFPVEPDEAAAIAVKYRDEGFAAQKWFLAHGPADGMKGMARNVELACTLREALGPYYKLMFDGHMGWDLPYAVEMARRLGPLHPYWLEEPAFPERVASLRRIREAGVPVATGEHVHTRWQVRELLAAEAVDFVQTDPDWTGGISEQRHICSLCSAFDVPVIAHGHGILPAMHVAAAQSPAVVPMVEYLFDHLESMQFFHDPVYRPVEGQLALPQLPGLGLVLDESKFEQREPVMLDR